MRVDCFHCEHFGVCKLEEAWNDAAKDFFAWAKNYQVLLNEVSAAVAKQCKQFVERQETQ